MTKTHYVVAEGTCFFRFQGDEDKMKSDDEKIILSKVTYSGQNEFESYESEKAKSVMFPRSKLIAIIEEED